MFLTSLLAQKTVAVIAELKKGSPLAHEGYLNLLSELAGDTTLIPSDENALKTSLHHPPGFSIQAI